MKLENHSICFSHMEDPDGVISGALIKQAFNSKIYLVNYRNFLNELRKIEKNKNLTELIICDLELKPNNSIDILKIIGNLSIRNVSIFFIDHHNLNSKIEEKLKKFNVRIINSEDECTSSLIYENFSEKLKENSLLLTACGCITDNREKGTVGKKILKKNDMMFFNLNSSLIWFYIKNNQNNLKKLLDIVDHFNNNYYPLEIQNIFDESKSFSTEISNSINKINDQTNNFRNFGCMEIFDGKLEFTAEKILSLSEKNISLVYRKTSKNSSDELIILSNNTCTKNIGNITNQLASIYDGSGGGDPKKSAAVIPDNNFEKFLCDLDSFLDISSENS
jgi:archaea-specific RecJ-like exonuclease